MKITNFHQTSSSDLQGAVPSTNAVSGTQTTTTRSPSSPELSRAMRQTPPSHGKQGTDISFSNMIEKAKHFFSDSVGSQHNSGSAAQNQESMTRREPSPDSSDTGRVTRLCREKLRTMEEPASSAYYHSKPDLELIHCGPGQIARGLYLPKVEEASRRRFAQSGASVGVTAVFRSETSSGYAAMEEQLGLFSYQTVGEPATPSDSSASSDESYVSQGGTKHFKLGPAHGDNHNTAHDLGSASIIGCVRSVTHQQDSKGLCKAFTDPRLKVVSASLTAAAYGDDAKAGIDADVESLKTLCGDVLGKKALENDLSFKTSFGPMLLGLMQRFASSADNNSVTLLSLENLKENGTKLKSVLVDMASRLETQGCAPKGFTHSLLHDVRAPNIMIDRIVPRPPTRVLLRTPSSFYDCRAGVVTEPHGRIVIEQDLNDLDPNLAFLQGTVEMTDQLDKHANAKAGMLNAVHTISGGIWKATHSDTTTLPEFLAQRGAAEFIKDVMTEIGQCLDPIDNFNMDDYRDQILTRFQNEDLADNMTRLSSQLTRKLKQYVAPVVQQALTKGTPTTKMMDALNVVIKAAAEQEPERQPEILDALSDGDEKLRNDLEQRLAAADQKLNSLGARKIFMPITSIAQSTSETFQEEGLDLESFINNPKSLPISLKEDTVVLFDNDGTLVNSESIALKAAHGLVTEVLASKGYDNPVSVSDFSQRFAGKNFSIILSELSEEVMGTKLTDDEIERYSIEEDDRCEAALNGHVTATPNTLQAIAWIPAKQKAVVTSASQSRCDASLNTLGIKADFDGVYSAVDSLPQPKPKPDPAIYQFAMDKLGITPDGARKGANVVVLEDSASGVTSARKAGANYVIGFVGADNLGSVDQKEERAAKLRAAGATDVIDDMALLPIVLEKRGLASRTDAANDINFSS
jgi:HAD superfamily hydrolase (TIGR01509 family)